MNWASVLVYLSDIFGVFNDLDISIQEKKATLFFFMADKIEE